MLARTLLGLSFFLTLAVEMPAQEGAVDANPHGTIYEF